VYLIILKTGHIFETGERIAAATSRASYTCFSEPWFESIWNQVFISILSALVKQQRLQNETGTNHYTTKKVKMLQ